MPFKTVKTLNLSEKVAQQIIQMIEEGVLRPGDRLPTETNLAEKLGVSRGILREGLSILQYKGYISRKARGGTFIRDLSESDYLEDSVVTALKKASYMDLMEMREALEQKIVELAVEKAKDSELKEIEILLDQSELSEENDLLLDSTFHLKLAQLSKNSLLVNFIEIYYGLIRDLGRNNFKSQQRKLEVIEEHRAIIKAISNRDSNTAKAAVLNHLYQVKESLKKIDMTKMTDI
ncbi:FadR family transcriptional regulator [Peribacillus muralis]|uniref:FadR/GntR family transcriptional regulator n=1 Tax=Peribacillus muralis TaxID=264697 RepID=UPI001F4D3AFC|nr:FadR/GntR family transcriptional regulator [Peribacillus muralis]MCK1993296.1 FadR family transcriptional regulator [Peribacillus muralis]MCK2013850.1 FadR family transcriptional regulator [Peribacillus muralis]